MPIKATDLKRGNALIWEGQLHVVIGTEHTKPGKGPAYVQAKMKNVATGTIKVNRINSSDKVEDVSIDKRKMEFLYTSGPNGPWVFMDQESYEQVELDEDLVGDSAKFLKETPSVRCRFSTRSLSASNCPRPSIWRSRNHTAAQGATVTNQLKEAVVETGARVRVPSFIEQGTVVRINTETGEYLGKA